MTNQWERLIRRSDLQSLGPPRWARCARYPGRSCCPRAWPRCGGPHGRTAPSASALRSHRSDAYWCHRPAVLRRHPGNIWRNRTEETRVTLHVAMCCEGVTTQASPLWSTMYLIFKNIIEQHSKSNKLTSVWSHAIPQHYSILIACCHRLLPYCCVITM